MSGTKITPLVEQIKAQLTTVARKFDGGDVVDWREYEVLQQIGSIGECVDRLRETFKFEVRKKED